MLKSLLIIVPTLNSFSLLPHLLISLQEQSWPHWRLIFIDGPSNVQHRQWLQECCDSDTRCSWVPQNVENPGIFGAMNQGFALASPDDWLLFWGSDDWAPHPKILEDVISKLDDSSKRGIFPDLLICSGRYSNVNTGELTRSTRFHRPGLLNQRDYRRALIFGSTPPHQATLFGPGAHQRLSRYSLSLRLAADLDYFLSFSGFHYILVQCVDLEIVHMSDGGVSNQQTQLRFQEVLLSYIKAFGWLWFLPFVARYIRRMVSLF